VCDDDDPMRCVCRGHGCEGEVITVQGTAEEFCSVAEPVVLPPGKWCAECGRPEVYDDGELCADCAWMAAGSEAR
jgi:hypothetical protein